MQTAITTSTTVMTTTYAAPPAMRNPREILYPLKPDVPPDYYAPSMPAAPLPMLPPQPPVVFQPPAAPPVAALPEEKPFRAQDVKIGHVGELLIGGITGVKHNAAFADALQKFKTDGFSMDNLKGLGKVSLKAGALSAGITGAVSAFENVRAAASGKITGKEAISNVTADSIGGMLSGTTAGIGAGAATMALRSFGVAGLPLTIGAAVAGALGGLGGSRLYEATGLKDRFFRATHEFFS